MKMNQIGNVYDDFVMKISKKTEKLAQTAIYLVIYKILLDYIYCRYIAGVHAFFYFVPSHINIINGWLALLIMIPLVNELYKQRLSSSLLILIFDIIYFIPITTYCGYGGGSGCFLFFSIIYWFLLTLLQLKVPTVVYEKSGLGLSDKTMYGIMFIVSGISLYIWVKYSHFRIQTNIIDVYEIRRQVALNPLPTLLSYILPTIFIVVPLLLVLFLKKKRYFVCMWLLFITLINFSYAGNKSVILFPIIIFIGYFFYRRNLISLIIPTGIVVELFAIIEQMLGNMMITSFIFRRQSIVLAQLSELYYRFFQNNTCDIFRSGILGKLGFDSIYKGNLANIIGNNFETQSVNCNNGMLSDVWSGLGLVGLVIMPIILIAIFRLIDFVTYKLDIRVVIGILVYYAIVFCNSSWSTVLLTHGLIMICVILFLLPREAERICGE